MRFKMWGKAYLLVAAAFVFFDQTPSRQAETQTADAQPPIQAAPTAQDFVTLVCEELRKHGEINNADLPWVVCAKHIRGNRLQLVKFLRRDPSGTGFDLVGAAVEVELCADNANHTIWIHSRGLELPTGLGLLWINERDCELDVPANLPNLTRTSWKSFAAAKRQLTAEQRKFFAEECFGQPAQKKLQQVFGRECDELCREQIIDRPSRGLLMAFDYDDAGPGYAKGSAFFAKGGGKVKRCSIVHFAEDGATVLSVERNVDWTLTADEWFDLVCSSDRGNRTLLDH